MSSRPLTVRTRLLGAFGALALLVLVVSGLSLRSLSRSHNDFSNYVEQTSARVGLANEVRAAANARAVSARNLVLVKDASDRGNEQRSVVQAHEQMQAVLKQLGEMVEQTEGVSDKERAQFKELARIESQYGPVALNIVDLAVHDRQEEAITKMNADCRPLLAALIKATNDYIALSTEQAKSDEAGAEADYEADRALLVTLCVLAVAASTGLAMMITRGLTRALGAEPAELGAAARRVAEGDLSLIEGAEQAPRRSVMASLGHMQGSLAGLVTQVRQASDSIATGSSQISNGASDLSQRTEEQASNLQETASSMEELHTTVKHNADTAQQATQLSASASQAASNGGQVMGQVVSTMQSISASSRKIGDIIGVIDGIAFQTNILALNAAVEAARAGEQGRGFAVVAGEVRSLAQRSGEAAKEIRTLIADSVSQVDAGSSLVNQAGSAMEDIVMQVKRVADLIGEISSASSEQTSGIGQVNLAVAQLDQMTQQNASLVEESAAAADSLHQQARRLTEAVSVFKLSNDGEHGSGNGMPATSGMGRQGGGRSLVPQLAH
ncbi:methyl-accepting chemotaxis protein [Aquabacterium soli]|uniref:Methyl-accepting chemotaxis protein n=1 Tax=Aquabacterium soli TaxID=2493092 RepID=A0A426VE27_9BURK|nr:methyl-accepting chemotaxis protein [Aquabacterium soli]RRS05121.1 methyl-accepting chemotaxis protein [Aquabacterium soli]